MDLSHLRVKDIMSTFAKTLTIHDRVCDAEALMSNYQISSVPITNDKDEVVGIFTKNDLNQKLSNEIHLVQFCQKNVLSVGSNASLAEAAELLKTNRVHHLVVTTNKGKPEGVLSTFDFLELVKF